jgi:hypothetical protein
MTRVVDYSLAGSAKQTQINASAICNVNPHHLSIDGVFVAFKVSLEKPLVLL